MEIKVVPFVPQVTDVNPAGSAASELQSIINQMQGQGWEYTVLLDENQDLKRNLGIVNVPFTLVLNSKGEIVWKHSGYSPGDEETLAEVVEEVAAGKSPSH